MDLLFLLGFVFAFCGHVQGDLHKVLPSFTKQSSGVGAEAVVAKPQSIRLDYAFYAGGASCRDFWQASGPKQTQPPNTAYRQAFRQLLEAGIQGSGISAKVASISVVCNDPAPEFFNDLRRVSLTAQLTPSLSYDDYGSVFLEVYSLLEENRFGFMDAFAAVAGTNSPFQPIPINYKENVRAAYICPDGFGVCAPNRWDPTSVDTLP